MKIINTCTCTLIFGIMVPNVKKASLSFVTLSAFLTLSSSFAPLRFRDRNYAISASKESSALDSMYEDRRQVLSKIMGGVIISASSIVGASFPVPCSAVDDPTDLTTRLFNPDGSFKQEMETEAKFRSVDLMFDDSDSLAIAVDGSYAGNTQKGSAFNVHYNLPEKWEDGSNLYFDRSEGVNQKVCNRIIVYEVPGKVTIERLEKASRVGIAKSLSVTDDLRVLDKADLIGGRTSIRDGQKYFEFDMAVAPSSCDSSSAENLGLGFCPYDSIYLLSSTVVDNKLFVLVTECDKGQWKRSNAELRRVRSSFDVKSI